MNELQITLQILGIIVLVLLTVLLGYLLYQLSRLRKTIDDIVEITEYYEKVKATVADFMDGPARSYLNALQMIVSYISPWLTKRRKSK